MDCSCDKCILKNAYYNAANIFSLLACSKSSYLASSKLL